MVDVASSTWQPLAPLAPPLPHPEAKNGCTSVLKLTVAGSVHPGGTTTPASLPPPLLVMCPASGEPPDAPPPELLDPPGLPPLLEPAPASGTPPAAASMPTGVPDPLLDDPVPLDDEMPLDDPAPLDEDELPGLSPLPDPPLLLPPELPDELPLPPKLPSTPDDDPPKPGLCVAGWELHAAHTPAPRTTRPTRGERAGRFMKRSLC